MGPKKNIKMDLSEFLSDSTFGGGSWADAEVDLNDIGASISTTAAPLGPAPGLSSAFGASTYSARPQFSDRPERKEYPVPDAPPYRARVNNLAWDASKDALAHFFEDRMQIPDAVTEVDLPMDMEFDRPKGFAFITFSEREILEEALNLNMAEFNGRKIFVNVAAPSRGGDFNGDWKSVRGSGMLSGGGDEPREEVVLDWGAARNARASLPQRERFGGDRPEHSDRPDRFDRPPREPEANLDWGSARGARAPLPDRPERESRDGFERGDRFERGDKFERGDRFQREPREFKEPEPELDWGSARNARGSLPPREHSDRPDRPERPQRTERAPRAPESEFDWSSARRSSNTLPPRERSERPEHAPRPPKDEPVMDWSRGQTLAPRAKKTAPAATAPGKAEKAKVQDAPVKSVFSVLDVEGEDEATSETVETLTGTGLESATEKLSVADDANDDGWETVRK